jgi:hypothetical protein
MSRLWTLIFGCRRFPVAALFGLRVRVLVRLFSQLQRLRALCGCQVSADQVFVDFGTTEEFFCALYREDFRSFIATNGARRSKRSCVT